MHNDAKEVVNAIADHIAQKREEAIRDIEQMREVLSVLGKMQALSGLLWHVKDYLEAKHADFDGEAFRNRAWPILPDDPSEVSGERVA